MSARRNHKRKDWPAHLYEPRPGYYVFRHPDGRTFPLGRIPLAVARNEALAANAHIAATKPGLVDRLTGATQTIAELLDKLPVSAVKSTREEAGASRPPSHLWAANAQADARCGWSGRTALARSNMPENPAPAAAHPTQEKR